ncbi:hypothetical protein M422DRAFT_31858 [Sphaerobolus stellatus SS14]|uniref:Uncharacterized protein n=1 Tax=Sphaerobolus stellatus (strain SS14) TaxID=990650 RepID=A0A0C9UDZ3_SPHS4|nr:hypothetical protein M422DRAFT_31858 [Sphaerobolus stellatus SS14]
MHSWFGNSSPGTPQAVALPTWNSPASPPPGNVQSFIEFAHEKSKTVSRESLKDLPRVQFRSSAAVGDTD